MVTGRMILTGLVVFALLLTGCSTTSVSGSWKNPGFSGKVSHIYIVGIAKQETNRRIFEDRFSSQLATYGVTGIASYRDLPASEEINKEMITAQVKSNGADAVLLSRIIGQETKEVVNPGMVTNVGPRPGYYGRRGYYPDPYYRNYGDYYAYSRQYAYTPATVTKYKVVTVEANLYQVETAELIWSAQLETVLDDNLDKLIADFVKVVTEDLHSNGLI
jgi:hypothetical protein